MSNRIEEIEQQAKVILEWCRQQRLPEEEERDILEFKKLFSSIWERVIEPSWNLSLGKFRLRKRPKKHTATVYWYRYGNGKVGSSLAQPHEHQWPGAVLLGTTTTEFTEPQE